jgi:hypothetical protein
MADYDVSATMRLLSSLDRQLALALQDAALAAARSVPPKPLGLEIFLCALNRRYPSRLRKHFRDPGSFAALNDAVWPNQGATNPTCPNETIEAHEGEQDTAVGIHIELDSDLGRILLNAARISSALLRRSASIPELIASLSTEHTVCESLKARWSIELKGLADAPERR